jgi:hypothetical protein
LPLDVLLANQFRLRRMGAFALIRVGFRVG